MTCPKCGATNADGVQFCTNCHATLIFKCPHCDHTQAHGGTCDTCGQNFAVFWCNYLAERSNEAKQIASDKTTAELGAVVTAAAAPLAGGGWLARVLLGQLLGRVTAWFGSRRG